MAANFSRQIENRNFLSPTGFIFSLAKYPKISFFSNNTIIPEITYTELEQSTSGLKRIPIPATWPTYGVFTLNFLVDEDMVNYATLHNWLIGVGFPKSSEQYDKFSRNRNGRIDTKEHYSDGTLSILNSNYNPVVNVRFTDLHPTSISSLNFDATQPDIQYLTAQATFAYMYYELLDKNGELYEPG